MIDLVTLAQTVTPGTLAQYGLPGLMIAWFALRAEKRLEAIETVIGTLAKTVLLDVVSRDATPEKVRKSAAEILEEIERRKK